MSENGRTMGKGERILGSLQKNDTAVVIGTVTSEPVYDGRKGRSFTDTRIIVAPEEPISEEHMLDAFAAALLPDVDGMNRRDAQTRLNESGEQLFPRLTSFDVVEPGRVFQRFRVEVFPNTQAAQEALLE